MHVIFLIATILAATTAPDPSDAKQAARAFESLGNSGDAVATLADCIGTEDQVAAAVAVANGAAAEHKLSDAARAKFGDQSATLLANPNYKPFDFPLDDPALTVSVDGDSARLIVPSRVKPLMMLIRSQGHWRVDCGSILFLSRSPSALAIVEDRSAQVKLELAGEITAGQYASAEDAARAKSEKILQAEGKTR